MWNTVIDSYELHMVSRPSNKLTYSIRNYTTMFIATKRLSLFCWDFYKETPLKNI